MVSTKTVCSQNNGEKSLTPEPFQEPEGMVTVDLNNSKTKNETAAKDDGLKNSKRRIVTEIILCLFLLNITVFGVLIVINQETFVFKTKPTQTDNKKSNSQTSGSNNNNNAIEDMSDIDIRKRRDVPPKSKSVKSAKAVKTNYEYPPYPHAEPIDTDRYFYYEDNNDLAYEYPLEEFVYYPDYFDPLNQHKNHPDTHYRASNVKNKATAGQLTQDVSKDVAAGKAKKANDGKSSSFFEKNKHRAIDNKADFGDKAVIKNAKNDFVLDAVKEMNDKKSLPLISQNAEKPTDETVPNKRKKAGVKQEGVHIKKDLSVDIAKETNNTEKSTLDIGQNGQHVQNDLMDDSTKDIHNTAAEVDPFFEINLLPLTENVADKKNDSKPTSVFQNTENGKDTDKKIMVGDSNFTSTIKLNREKVNQEMDEEYNSEINKKGRKIGKCKEGVYLNKPNQINNPIETADESKLNTNSNEDLRNTQEYFGESSTSEQCDTELENENKYNSENGDKMFDSNHEDQPDKISLPIKITENPNEELKNAKDNYDHGKQEMELQSRTNQNTYEDKTENGGQINHSTSSKEPNDKNIGDNKLNNGEDRSNVGNDPRNRQKNTMPIATIDMQSSQQAIYNPCLTPITPYGTQFKLANAENNQLFKIVAESTPKFSSYVMNPPVYPYLQSPYMIPQQLVPNYVPQQVQSGPIQVNGPGGQFYICNPISAPTNNVMANNIANMPGVEVRRDASNLQDLLGGLPKPEKPDQKSRASQIICPIGYESCSDESKCIRKHHFCDNEAHCNDGSDEIYCSCKERVGKLRRCDGYFDCPDGEDELGCFGCDKNEFSCDDWSKFKRSTCIPIEQRCDNIRHCEITGKDEEDCSVLSDIIGEQPLFKISNSVGFLHRNYKGKWFPTCFGTELWAMDVCKAESGPMSVFPKTHMVLITDNYNGPFINILLNQEISLVKNCVQDRAAFVECPPLFCGMRMTVKNPYRQHEVDISAENIIDDLERVSNNVHPKHATEKHSKDSDAKNNEKEDTLNDKEDTYNDRNGYIKLNNEEDPNDQHNTDSGARNDENEDTVSNKEDSIVKDGSVVDEDKLNNEEDPILGDSRVVGGNPSQPAAWPWLVSIYRNGIFHCGGVLVHESWIITASHCADRYWQYYFEIQAGMLRRFSFAPMEQHRWVRAVITNENYNRATLRNDIALMKLSAPVRFNRYVRPICLPSEVTAGRDFLSGPTPGTICTTVGWGATIEHGSDPDHMREVQVPVLERCKHGDDLVEDEICAGLSEGGKDACQGDSGGPLMCRNPNNPSQWYLAGIVSHGEGCARPNEPGVYTKVAKFVGWIAENIGEQKFMPRFPLQHCPGYICKSSRRCLPKKHHCDKIVDCLFGDDETECSRSFQNLFKHARERENEMDSNADGLDPVLTNPPTGNVTNVTDGFKHILNGIEGIKETNGTVVNELAFNNSTVISSEGFTNSTNVNETNMASNHSDVEDIFYKCRRKKCNKIMDCEDGTDEDNCQCADYVTSQNPKAICDGITDCYDLSDEQCVKCTKEEYYCRLSQTCIDISKRCDGISDCSKSDDEWDCVALTNGKTLTLDADSRPNLSISGIISVNRKGIWRPLCLNSTQIPAEIVSNVCYLLGFEEYISFHEYQVEDKPLDEKEEMSLNKTEDGANDNKTCGGLYVKCSNVSLDSSVHNVHLDSASDELELYIAPWNAVIYSDGIYRCMGAILNSQWIVTSVNCFEGIADLKSHYVAVLLGKGKATLEVKGPHEQALRIVDSITVPKTDILLLRSEKNIIYSRYTKHLRLSLRRDGIRTEKCVAIGLHNNKAKYEFLRPIQNCEVGFRCFETKLKTECKDLRSWSGTVVCDSGSGWYPAAVYYEKDGLCGISSVEKYTSVPYHKKEIRKMMEQASSHVDAPNCDGFRCALGECISKSKTCNGIPNCRGEEDEEADLCYENERLCHLTGDCVCDQTEIKCKNGKCLDKSKFCDRTDDCGDYSDEPNVCDCKSYLELTNPGKICDGVVHCMDRTDEDPQKCPCQSNGFHCLSVDVCVGNDMVCDGFEDCPNGEDEKVCFDIITEHNETSNAGELVSRTGGIWHSGCFHSNYSAQELEQICQDLGFDGGTANQLAPPKNVHNITALRPAIESFEMIWIRRDHNSKFRLGLRTGNEPYVSFEPDEECFKLFIACL